MTTNRIDEIRVREQAATPGHWSTHYDGKGTYLIEARPRLIPGVGNTSEGIVATLNGEHGDGQTYHNARFAAHAREDVPYLLERVADLERKNDALSRELLRVTEERNTAWEKERTA